MRYDKIEFLTFQGDQKFLLLLWNISLSNAAYHASRFIEVVAGGCLVLVVVLR